MLLSLNKKGTPQAAAHFFFFEIKLFLHSQFCKANEKALILNSTQIIWQLIISIQSIALQCQNDSVNFFLLLLKTFLLDWQGLLWIFTWLDFNYFFFSWNLIPKMKMSNDECACSWLLPFFLFSFFFESWAKNFNVIAKVNECMGFLMHWKIKNFFTPKNMSMQVTIYWRW